MVLSKLGQAMGVGVPGEAGLQIPGESANDDEEEEEGDEEEDELTVHHTASTGDIEVWCTSHPSELVELHECIVLPVVSFETKGFI